MTEVQGEERKSRQHRSPTYPSIDLGAAIQRADQLYRAENRHFAPISAIVQAWDYSPKSSGGRLAVAALKRYGLLEDRGALDGREARITELAQAIILDQREDSSERLQRIRDAALNVPLIREILDKYQGDLPSDATLRYHLSVDRGFSPGGADEFIDVLRKTLAFARLPLKSDTVLPTSGDTEHLEPEQPKTPVGTVPAAGPVAAPGVVAVTPPPVGAPAPIQFPVAGGATITLQSTGPLTESAWDQMMAVLVALKSAIVAPAPQAKERVSETWTSKFGVGDLVNWESQGVLQGEGLKVVRVADDPDGREYAFVEGSDTGIPVDQLTLARDR